MTDSKPHKKTKQQKTPQKENSQKHQQLKQYIIFQNQMTDVLIVRSNYILYNNI